MLTEGFDEPSVSCIIVARPTMSRPLYVQMIGRGTRLYPGKPDVLILHLVAATSRLELVTAPTLFGLPPRDLATNTITAVLERREQVAKLAKQRQTGSVLVARAVNVLQRLAWVETESGFAVSLGAGGSLHLLPSASGIWSVAQQVDGTRHMLATGLDIGYAQGCAEDHVRRIGAQHLVDPQAAWRQDLATDRQYWRMHQLGDNPPPDLTKGEASARITRPLNARGGAA